MDFLDPRKRRSHKIRLLTGYFLVTIAIGLATVILVYGANGYGIDTKTGEIVQNGLLFVDSKPGNAAIYLNGKFQNSTTNARLILPARQYDLELRKAGYNSWRRSFTLNELEIKRFVYPFLYPTKPVSYNLKSYASLPPLLTQSPDRRRLLVQLPSLSRQAFVFDEYDTSDINIPPKQITVPQGLLSAAGGTLSEVEWSYDNNYVLLRHNFTGGYEFLLIDRREPLKSVNINRLFKLNPAQVALYDKKANKVYIFDQQTQTLRLGGLGNGALEPVLLTQVLAFKPYGSNLISYITASQAASGQVSARIWENGRTYALSPVTPGDRYLLELAEFQGRWYYVVGSNKASRLIIFKDPLSDLKNNSIRRALPDINLPIDNASDVKFSNNTRFVAAQSGQKLAVYDFEAEETFIYTAQDAAKNLMKWMDGHRLISSSVGGEIVVFDYDSTNRNVLAKTALDNGGFFSGNFNFLFTVSAAADGKTANLQAIDMRAGSDLPQNR